MGAAVYLTGIPGTGKSTVASALAQRGVAVFSYSEHLGRALQTGRDALRRESAGVVTADVVARLDEDVARFVASRVTSGHVLVDSHAVTYETFGLRVIPFAPEVLAGLGLDAVVCLSVGSDVIVERLASAPDGRPTKTVEQVEQARQLQADVAVSYAAQLGKPLYVIDANAGVETVVERVAHVLERSSPTP